MRTAPTSAHPDPSRGDRAGRTRLPIEVAWAVRGHGILKRTAPALHRVVVSLVLQQSIEIVGLCGVQYGGSG